MGYKDIKPRWKKGESGNPNGRPKKLHPTLMKTTAYSKSQIADIIQYMVSLTEKEIDEIIEDTKSTVFEKTIANAIKKSLQKGYLDSIETLLNRVHGKPNQSVDITSNGNTIDNKIEIEIIKSKIIEK
jgi:type IV secretory pathway protease TraF